MAAQPSPKPLAHPLKDAYARLDRGIKHLRDLDALHDLHSDQVIRQAVLQGKADFPEKSEQRVWGIEFKAIEVSDDFRALVGDAAHSFRSALDYLIARLADLDGGVKRRRTQFPIEDSPDGFARRRRVYLAGLTDSHVRAIESMQPYNGCQWVKRLQTLSNLDKHIKLVVTQHGMRIVASGTREVSEDPANPTPTKIQVGVYFYPHLLVTLGDGKLPIKETLHEIETAVRQVLDFFKPEFQV